MTYVFREFGVPTVQSTPDPDVAWKMFRRFPIDLVLGDWTSDLDGMGFLNKDRQDTDTPNPFIPVIICIANTEYLQVCFARYMGMTEFLAARLTASAKRSRLFSLSILAKH